MDSASSLALLGFKQPSVCLVDCMKTPGVLRPEPEGSSGGLPVLTQMDLSISLVECMKTPGLNGDGDHLNHGSLELELKEEEEQSEGEYDYPKLEQQASEIIAEIHLYKEEEDKNSIWVEAKTEEHAGTDGKLLLFEANGGGSEGTAWLIQCPELSESLKAAMLSASSVVRQEEVDATSQQSQEDDALFDRIETSQQNTEAEEEAAAVETPETESGVGSFADVPDSVDQKLTSLDARLALVEVLHKEFQQLRESMEFSQEQVATLAAENKTLRENVKQLTDGMTQLSGENKKMKETILDIQARSMRDNLVFSGIPEEAEEDAEASVRGVLQQQVKLPSELVNNTSSHRVHRRGANEAQTEKSQEDAAPKPRHHQCELCGKSFARKSNVLRHQQQNCSRTRATEDLEQTEQKRFSCRKCSPTFGTKCGLKLHKVCHKKNRENNKGIDTNQVERERPHTCMQCNKSFYALHTLQQHLLTHTGEKSYHCEVCGKQFGREGTLKEHMVIHTGDKPYKCDQCGKTCARRGDLRIHMLSHSEERPHNCSQCGKSFKRRAKLKKHERIHTGEKPYQCQLCPKTFRLQESLATHILKHTGEQPFRCSLCPKAFSVRSNLRKHKMIHTGEKRFRCSQCSKSFRLQQHLIFHERGHTGEKPYKCGKCGKAYCHPSTLKTHQASHEAKPTYCFLCRQEFTKQEELANHKCGETAEKPHRCSQCGKCFSKVVNMKKHQLIHSGEKPYVCKECGRQFNHNGNLTKHMRIHTGERPFECELCKRRFRLLQHLRNHRLIHNKKK